MSHIMGKEQGQPRQLSEGTVKTIRSLSHSAKENPETYYTYPLAERNPKDPTGFYVRAIVLPPHRPLQLEANYYHVVYLPGSDILEEKAAKRNRIHFLRESEEETVSGDTIIISEQIIGKPGSSHEFGVSSTPTEIYAAGSSQAVLIVASYDPSKIPF